MRKILKPKFLLFFLVILGAFLAIQYEVIILRLPNYLIFITAGAISALVYLITRSTAKLGILFMALGFSAILTVPNSWLWGWWERRDLSADFNQQSAAALVLNQSILNDMQGVAETERLRQLAYEYREQIKPEQTIAQLEIPRIGVNAIVVEGSEDASLRKGVGHLEETKLPGMGGNFAVAADRVLYGGLFLNLDKLEPGDEIFVKTPYGKFVYEVSTKKIILPDEYFESGGKEMITLITCDPPWNTSHRLIIEGLATESSLL